MKMCKDSHHHNFFLYSYCLKIKDACVHAYIVARYNKYRQKFGKQTEEGRVQVWLFVDVFQDNDCAKQFSRSSHLIHLLLFYATILYCCCCDTHRKHPSYAWLVSISRHCMCVFGRRQIIQRNLAIALTIGEEKYIG